MTDDRETIPLPDGCTGLEPDCYDAGLLGSYGGGDVHWWQDYIRIELARAHDFYADQFRRLASSSQDHHATPADGAAGRAEDETSHLIKAVGEQVEQEKSGVWRACSGCQESNEGYLDPKLWSQSMIFRTQPGAGCSECGGIGVIWDTADYTTGGDFLAQETAPQPPSDKAGAAVGGRDGWRPITERALANPSATRRQEDAGAGRPVTVEDLAKHLHDEEFGYDWTWPEHDDDDGYRGNGAYVRVTPIDVRLRCREAATRIWTMLRLGVPTPPADKAGAEVARPHPGDGTAKRQDEGGEL